MIVDSNSSDIVYSNLFTGVHGNYLKGSIAAAGLDPADLPESDPSTMDFSSGGNLDAKAWREAWVLAKSLSVQNLINQLTREYDHAREGLTLV